MARYSKAFRTKVVVRLLPPESAAPEKVSREIGVRADTLSRWPAEALSDSVHSTDYSDHAARVVKRAAIAECIVGQGRKPILHGDNGATLKATTVLAMFNWLGIKSWYSRPRVSDDNAFPGALFKTVKYRPEHPTRSSANLDEARQWASDFVRWYNHEHRLSRIHYVAPHERHTGRDRQLLAARREVHEQAKLSCSRRWNGRAIRDGERHEVVTLTPERDAVCAISAMPNPEERFA